MEPRRILLITYVFPPVGGIMVQRVLSFAKHLPKHGFEVHVLTARNPATPVYDPGLLKLVPPEVRIHRAFTPEPPFYLRKKVWELFSGGKSKAAVKEDAAPAAGGGGGLRARLSESVKSFLSPDVQVLWAPFALRRAASVIRRHNIDTVLVTVPPFSLLTVGNALKRRFPHITLVSDFRDEWLRFMLADFDFMASDATRKRAEQIERETMERSDLVLAVTRTSLREIRQPYPEQPAEKYAFVANGFDPGVLGSFTPRPQRQGGRMIVTHMGTAYKTSSPRYYLDALDELPEQIRSTIETRFIGRIAETEAGLFEKRKSPVVLLGFQPQAEALRKTEESDYLLLTMTNDFSLPGKLFEYLATGTQVLALSPPGGEVDQLLKETGGGDCVDHTDPAAIRAMLTAAWERWRDGRHRPEPNWEAIRSYERARLAEKLAGLLRR